MSDPVRTARVLIVDDDPDSLTALFTILTSAGYSVLSARDGQEALDIVECGVLPLLLIVDLMLPKVSGQEFLKHVATEPHLRHIPVIVTTALARDEFRVHADVIFHKPLDFEALLRAVRSLIGGAAPEGF